MDLPGYCLRTIWRPTIGSFLSRNSERIRCQFAEHFDNPCHRDPLFRGMANQRLAQDRGERFRSIASKELAVHFVNLSEGLQEIAFSDRSFPGGHLVQDQAKRKDVARSGG